MTLESVQKSGDFRPDINGLRAIAVVAVVLFHFGTPGFGGGFIGVDVFFVISGFLMTKIIVKKLEKGRFSILDFWLSRARRIFPALAVLCAFMLLLGVVSIDPMSYRNLAVHAASSLVFLSNIVFWSDAGYFDASSKEKWLLHTWSLSVEWQFYLLLPIALVLVWKIFGSRRAIFWAIVAAFIASLAVSIVGTKIRPAAAYYLLPTRAWEMMAGGMVYLLALRHAPSRGLGRVLEWVGLIMIVASAVMIDAKNPWPGSLALMPVIGTALVIFARQTASFFTSNRVMAFVGNTSYSIYLWHWPVAVAFYLQGVEASWLSISSGAALSLLLGYLSFRFVETPLRKPPESLTQAKEALSYGAAGAVLIGAAMFIRLADGLPSRLKEDETNYLRAVAAINDWGHPGKNCDELLVEVRCWRPGQGNSLVMFIGDSLAEQWYPRYGDGGADTPFSTLFITKGACLPIRGLGSAIGGEHCAEFANTAWETVFERKPAKLIIASIWLTYFFDADGNRRSGVCVVEQDGCTRVTDDKNLAKVFERLVPDIRRAINEGIAVYILAPTPQSGVDYPKVRLAEITARHLTLTFTRAPTEHTVRQAFEVDGRRYSQGLIVELLAKVAAESGAQLVIPEQYMCPHNLCPNVDSLNRPIYKDRGHLRKSYVQSDAVTWLDGVIGIEP